MLRTFLRTTLDHFPAAVQFLRNSRDLLDRRAPARMTPWGFRLAGHKMMASGAFEPVETALVRELLQEVDLLVNVGANIGYYCCHALSLGKPVIAIEPMAQNLHYLLTNIKNNGWAQQAEVYPVALGCRPDVLQIWGSGTGASLIKGWASIPENYVTLAPVLTLDRLLGDALSGKKALILADIEGAEYMMLQGASQILRNQPRPIWLMEITTTEHQPQGVDVNPYFGDTFALMFEAGYRAFIADGNHRELTRQDVVKISSQSQTPETHNIIFR
jgi:FkbM family methyltransferase